MGRNVRKTSQRTGGKVMDIMDTQLGLDTFRMANTYFQGKLDLMEKKQHSEILDVDVVKANQRINELLESGARYVDLVDFQGRKIFVYAE